jgi:hypothetical protein
VRVSKKIERAAYGAGVIWAICVVDVVGVVDVEAFL